MKECKRKIKGWSNMMIFIVVILFVGWWIIPPSDNDTISIQNDSLGVKDNFPDIEELHWGQMPITYSYGERCIGPIIPRLEWAFDILEDDTGGLLTFKNVYGDDADISFVCHSTKNTEAGESTFYTYSTVHIYGQSLIEEQTGSVIEKTTIEFWNVKENTRPPSCFSFPNLELHEIIHSLGVGHIENNRYSLMYWEAWSECVAKNQTITLHSTGKTFTPEDKIDDEIIDCLKYIYSKGEYEKNCSGLIEYVCDEGLYATEDGYCCEKPSMIINEEGYCDYPEKNVSCQEGYFLAINSDTICCRGEGKKLDPRNGRNRRCIE